MLAATRQPFDNRGRARETLMQHVDEDADSARGAPVLTSAAAMRLLRTISPLACFHCRSPRSTASSGLNGSLADLLPASGAAVQLIALLRTLKCAKYPGRDWSAEVGDRGSVFAFFALSVHLVASRTRLSPPPRPRPRLLSRAQ